MEDSLFGPDEPITPELLAKKLQEVKDIADKKLSDLQSQVSAIKQKVNDLDAKTTKRLLKITNLIDQSFDNFQQVMLIFGDIMTKVNECEKTGQQTKNSIAINKHNLVELNKYVKAANKSLNDVIKEVDALNKSKLKFDLKTMLKIAAGLVLFGVALGNMSDEGVVSAILQFLGQIFKIGSVG